MEAKATLRYARISPRKVKIVCDLIRGKSVAQATAILMNTPKAASELMLKLLKSAASNASNTSSNCFMVETSFSARAVYASSLSTVFSSSAAFSTIVITGNTTLRSDLAS